MSIMYISSGRRHVKITVHCPTENPDIIPSDGIHDEIAIDTAVRGIRRVRLSPTERAMVACKILSTGGTASTLQDRLGVNSATAYWLTAKHEKAHAAGSCVWDGAVITPA